jgi:hypothetical protein
MMAISTIRDKICAKDSSGILFLANECIFIVFDYLPKKD